MKSKNFLDRARFVFDSCSKEKIDALLIEKPIDLYYLTGLDLSLGSLLISKKGAQLFVDGRYLEMAKKKGPYPCVLSLPANIKKAFDRCSSIGFDSAETTYQRWEVLKKLGNFIPIKKPTDSARAIKSKEELKALKKSAALLWKGYEHIRKNLAVGVTEKEVAANFEIFCLENGAEKMAFDPIVAFGKNTAFPHYRPGNIRLKKGDIVLLDLGVVIDHYHSDMTRTFFFGKGDPRLVKFETVVKEAHDAALHLCHPGAKIGDLDAAATQVIKKAGLEKYIAHSLGHGVGLEIHEFPRIRYKGEDHDTVLQEGMVITIEPGLYWAGVGGYRFEDTIVITKKGYENWYP
jgi:Xaa-Pro aminopeptidase